MCRLTEALRPTDRLVRALIAPTLIFLAAVTDRNYQTDLWHHLARGRVLVEQGELLNDDRFTFTVAGTPLRDVNWGWQAAFYLLFRTGGLPLVQTANALLLALMMSVLFGLVARRCGSRIIAAGICIGVFLGLWPLLIIRPQTVSLLFFAIAADLLERARSSPRWLFALPPLFVVWANCHGGFPIGLVLVASDLVGAALGSKVRRFAIGMSCLLACGVATLANPYGWHVYEYVLGTTKFASSRRIDEWLPPSLDTLTGQAWVVSLVLLITLATLPRSRLSWRDVVVLGCFLPLAAGSVRMVAWWLLVLAPILAERIVHSLRILRAIDANDDRVSLGATLSVLALILAALSGLPCFEQFSPSRRFTTQGERMETHLQAVADHIDSAGRGRLFTRFAWGEYFGWSFGPHQMLFSDGRIEIYPDAVWEESSAITRGRADWDALLAAHKVRWLLLDRSGYHHDLLPQVERSQQWRQVGEWGSAVLFEHVVPGERAD